jgi:GntR family transcriptional regulator
MIGRPVTVDDALSLCAVSRRIGLNDDVRRSLADVAMRPVGYELANILRNRIAEAQYREKFPTEREIISEFGASRYAVRSALERLVSDGLIQRRAGSGTRIVDPAEADQSWAIRTVEDLIGRNLHIRTRLLSAAPAASRQFPEVAHLFGSAAGKKLFVVDRLAQLAAAVPHFYSLTFMPLDVGLALGATIDDRPIILQIEDSRRIKAHRVRQEITTQQANPRVAQNLAVPAGKEVITLRRTYFDRDGAVIVHGELFYPIGQFRQTIELLRDPTGS